MNAIEMLLSKGHIELNGLVKDKIIPIMKKVVINNDDVAGIYIFETRKVDGFHSDLTSVYAIDANASFRPRCSMKYGSAAMVCVTEVNKALVRSLRGLEVCPMLENEYQELVNLGVIKKN